MITSSAFLPMKHKSGKKLSRETIAEIPATVINTAYTNEMSFSRRIQSFMEFALLASYEVMRHKADVVFATSTPLTIIIPALCAKFWHHAPIVFEVRDLWPELPIAVGAIRNPLMKSLSRQMEWTAYHSARHIIALSPGMAEGVTKRGIPPDKISVLPNSCDVEVFDIPPIEGKSIRDRLELLPNQPLVVYAGSFGHINHVTYLVEVATAMIDIAPEITFLLVGSGAQRQTIIGQAIKNGLYNQNLLVWDPIPKRQMPALLAASTIATSIFAPLPPMWNNSANKFFDSLAACKPIAINYEGWQAHLLRETGAGIVLSAEDPLRAAKDLANFLRDPSRLLLASQAARSLAYGPFNRNSIAQKFEQILQNAANHEN